MAKKASWSAPAKRVTTVNVQRDYEMLFQLYALEKFKEPNASLGLRAMIHQLLGDDPHLATLAERAAQMAEAGEQVTNIRQESRTTYLSLYAQALLLALAAQWGEDSASLGLKLAVMRLGEYAPYKGVLAALEAGEAVPTAVDWPGALESDWLAEHTQGGVSFTAPPYAWAFLKLVGGNYAAGVREVLARLARLDGEFKALMPAAKAAADDAETMLGLLEGNTKRTTAVEKVMQAEVRKRTILDWRIGDPKQFAQKLKTYRGT